MREPTPEMKELLEFITTSEYLARKAKEQSESQAAMAAAAAEAKRLWAIQEEQNERARMAREEEIRPLREALRASGIQLAFNGYYEGCWMKYQIGDGPVVEVEEGLDTFEED